ncbi:adenylate cyclase associated N terminal-domain-containing protein [Gilbertella persicaria]|uniref:adenylate cyclase associated N terminal-domain-containing protein n=1 Tax=Gilbertella persicaria TaxID=101096 RepID=UPI00221E6CC7|nr:adenylate cyclase associated N terminal-domain-containing protein [Gilbertella persicaria]KAI8077299.1 adenylate cyclase associated N terminal-domain-containing protein [Gilbertella persicaria]
MSEFHSLANLIKRLEVATTRLEDLAMSSSSASAVAAHSPSSPKAVAPANTTTTAAAATTTTTAASGSSSSDNSSATSGSEETSAAVEKHDAAINASLEKYIALSQELGDVVAEQALLVKQAVDAERDIIHMSALAQKPDMTSPTFMKILEPIQKSLGSIIEIKDANRPSPMFNHLSTVAEGIPALGWFTCEPTPVPFIRDMKDAAQFYSNRVVKEWKEKEPKHVEWSHAFLALLESLAIYVKENFPTGLTWNAKGEKPDSFIGKTSVKKETPTAAAPSTSGGPPPPPPPPPPMVIEEDENTKPVAATGAAAVFAEINKGASVTANLRKVDKSEMTHKNPSLRAAAPTSPKRQGPPTPNKPDKYTLKKAAKTSLEANKWVVENHENNHQVVIEETAINQAVYIYNCKNSTIRIKGKVNAVTIDSCTKCGIAVDSTVATVDVVNSKSFALQVFKVVPTIAVDKCDGGEIYLSKDCLGVEILSAKSTSLNVLVPEGTENEDVEYKERPVPEQFKTTIVDGKLVTVTVEHAG